ncbi:tRNA (adenosine(37)-N6)-threonylcarbamoyltransferase complex dimerization subunit type 1 TsaB [Pseudonocardia xishanensis]|uniref:tRNA (Adenosine(37)-N6)-threonylcarbamoyltransferase complex dimerization subunit type 1 TsaB n=1 Tax=Pseudonocardia xishanensis TaxID=630995 RepID=A0ABP8RT40_9PSEU
MALDTSTPAVTAGVVRDGVLLAERVTQDGRKHGELLMPGVQAACAEAGVRLPELDAIVVGAGPGPFTGLRVGMVTAAALGDALGVPVHGVCSLDAIAAVTPCEGNLLVATDARRREVYWAAYDGPEAHDGAGEGVRRLTGPHVGAAESIGVADLHVVAAAGTMADRFGLPVAGPATPTPLGLVAVAALHGVPGPLEPLYLRRPDAVPPGERKKVTP